MSTRYTTVLLHGASPCTIHYQDKTTFIKAVAKKLKCLPDEIEFRNRNGDWFSGKELATYDLDTSESIMAFKSATFTLGCNKELVVLVVMDNLLVEVAYTDQFDLVNTLCEHLHCEKTKLVMLDPHGKEFTLWKKIRPGRSFQKMPFYYAVKVN